MKYRIVRNYTANANRFTFGLITLVMLGFGAVAQSQELQIGSSPTQSTMCQTFAPSLCNQLEQIQLQANQPLFLIQ